MDMKTLLSDKTIKAMEKRTLLVKALTEGELSLQQLEDQCDQLTSAQNATVLEAIEELTNKKVISPDVGYLQFAVPFLQSEYNPCKREASRIIGNLASSYPTELKGAIEPLLKNTEHESTVVRWGSAYALSRIIELKEFANTELFAIINEICAREEESGVKNQYLRGLKRAAKLRK